MVDKLDPARRSENMRRIRSSGMKPEVEVRRIVHRLGYRFRLHRVDLPGKPDLVLPRLKRVIFVHGCFWHQHSRCVEGRMPKSRLDYWQPKLQGNVQRDARNLRKLRRMGWKALVIWECEMNDVANVRSRISRFLSGDPL